MKNLARGSVFLSLVALIGFLFYFQSTVIAEGTFSIANDSKGNIQLEEIQQNNQINQQNNQQNQTIESTLINLKYNNFTPFDGKSFRATAYCLKGRTATGGSVRRGIVAADRRVLPLGTRIQVSAGAYSGTYTVADTGGAVKGNVLDIWVPSCSEANRFGRRTVTVSILGKD
ncbi:MAG TPA: 3D domain-containing protein [Pyrinomonadaceae bacterium]|jgi:3D (Asp-Asp-Asp) domain-containing protein